jgi:predicted PurR-regulated permease PerM
MTRRAIAIGLAVMTTLLGLVVVWQFRIAVVYVLISLVIAAALRPLASRLEGRRTLERAAWIVLYVVVAVGVGLTVFLTSTYAITEIQALAGSVSVQDAWTLPAWLKDSAFERLLAATLPAPSKLFVAITGSKGQLVLPAVFGFVQGVGGLISAAVVISILSIYWSTSQGHFERLWLSLLPSDQRTPARSIWQLVESQLGAYIRGQLVESILVGVLLVLGYRLLGSPYPALLAAAGALASLVPVVGAALAVTAALLVGLLTSAQLGVVSALYALTVVAAIGGWIIPRLFGRRWSNPILTTVLLLALADALGLLGILVAPPLSVVCQILWRRLVSHRRSAQAATQVSDLVARQERAWAIIKGMDGPTPHLVSSSMDRLSDLIERARPILDAAGPGEPPDASIATSSTAAGEGSVAST